MLTWCIGVGTQLSRHPVGLAVGSTLHDSGQHRNHRSAQLGRCSSDNQDVRTLIPPIHHPSAHRS
jgi:hypothetical protein